MRNLSRSAFPAATLLVIACLLGAYLPISGALWFEELTISASVETGTWGTLTPTPTKTGQAGTTLAAGKTAAGFSELRGGVLVSGVRGEVCVSNGGERETIGLTIIDTVQTKDGPGPFQDYFSAMLDVSAKPVLAAGEQHCYPYEIVFAPPAGNAVKYRNTASVTILNHSGWLPDGANCSGAEPCPFGPRPRADFSLPASPTPTASALPTKKPPVGKTPVSPIILTPGLTFTATPLPPTETPTPAPEPSLTPNQPPTEPPTAEPSPTPSAAPPVDTPTSEPSPTPSEVPPTETAGATETGSPPPEETP